MRTLVLVSCALAAHAAPIGNRLFRIDVSPGSGALWTYTVKSSGRSYAFAAPTFEVGGVPRQAQLASVDAAAPGSLPNGTTEHRFVGRFVEDRSLSLELIFRVAPDNPVVRFRYILRSTSSRTMTKSKGEDAITYLDTSLAGLSRFKEVRLSDFSDQLHTYTLDEIEVDSRHFDHQIPLFGPMFVGSAAGASMLIAYEHGSELPDAFVHFIPARDRHVSVRAVKGNYFSGQPLGPRSPYETIWFEVAAISGDEERMAAAFRTFVLRYQSLDHESRKPYIVFDTWNYQERDKWWYKHTYLDSMNENRVLAEIEVAAKLGVDIFYLDAGWFAKTGDWKPAMSRFPHGLEPIRQALKRHGMYLGLWFDPTAAALTSSLLAKHRDDIAARDGVPPKPLIIWETEQSYRMCLVSPFIEAVTAELIRMLREHDVKYVLFDAVHQDQCNAAGHWHGTKENSAAERGDSFAFQLVGRLTRMAEQVQISLPGIIVDLDVTERHRAFGLGYLAVGKFYLMNNGPYFQNLDIPVPADSNVQPLFYNGQARAWFLRGSLTLDKWVPSVLLDGMYFPEEPYRYQVINAASLILGHNGLWGDLLSMSEQGVAAFGKLMNLYKQVRDDMAETALVRTGMISGSPEIYEKISSQTHRGAVVLFATEAGEYEFVTSQPVAGTHWETEGAAVSIDASGRAKITARFTEPGAQIVFFGVRANDSLAGQQKTTSVVNIFAQVTETR